MEEKTAFDYTHGMSAKASKYNKILAVMAFIVLVFGLFIKYRHSNHIHEATRLPFRSVSLEDVEDGTYRGKTYTSFMHFQADVTVENHALKDISIVENGGSQGIHAKEFVAKMVEENRIKIPVIEKDELGCFVIMSCVDTALFESLSDDAKKKYTGN